MAYTLSISPFSFVRFAPDAPIACCDEPNSFLLPVVLANDIQFQFSLVFDTNAEATAAMNDAPGNISLRLLKGASNTPQTIPANQVYNFTGAANLFFTKYLTAPNRVTYTWLNGFPGFNTKIACDACFQVVVIGTVNSTSIMLLSNGFIRRCSTCDSSVLVYGSDNNYGGYIYCNTSSFANRVRLPFYLKQPQPKFDRAVYRKSSGKIRNTKSVITKEYAGTTNYLSEAIHDRLVIALEHDTVGVESDTYSGGISASDYEIDWQEDLCKAQAKFKALATPFFVSRTNCATC